MRSASFKEIEQLSTMLMTPSKASTGERLSLAHVWRVSSTHQSWRWQSNMPVLILCLLGSGRHSTNFLKVSRSYFVVRAELVQLHFENTTNLRCIVVFEFFTTDASSRLVIRPSMLDEAKLAALQDCFSLFVTILRLLHFLYWLLR